MTQPVPQSFQAFSRACTVTVGPVRISNFGQQTGLDVWFQVKKSLKPKTPNTCTLRLYNLSDSTRKAIEQAAQPLPPPGGSAPQATIKTADSILDNTGTPVSIVAGYVGATGLVFQGALRSAQTVTDGPDTVTELTSGDGDSSAILARTSFAFGKGANAYKAALQLLADMKCGLGNTASFQNTLQASPAYANGIVLKGSSFHMLCDLAQSAGLEVTLQNGVPLWLVAGQPTPGNAYLLQTEPQNTGVYGTPSVDTKGTVSIEAGMFPGLVVGGPIQIATRYIKGLYRICSAEWTGGTRDNSWSVKCEAKRYGLAP